MKNFVYYRPKTAEQAVGLLDDKWGTTELLAGGTDLHDLQKEYVATPDKVVSLTGLGGAFTKIGVSAGEPPTISTHAAIANAIFNAIGVRVPTTPFTPDKVLAALAKG